MYLISVVYSMLVMMNFLGCLLFFIAYLEDKSLDGTWLFKYLSGTEDIPDDVDPDRYILEVIDDRTHSELYLTSLYWAVTTVSVARHDSRCNIAGRSPLWDTATSPLTPSPR